MRTTGRTRGEAAQEMGCSTGGIGSTGRWRQHGEVEAAQGGGGRKGRWGQHRLDEAAQGGKNGTKELGARDHCVIDCCLLTCRALWQLLCDSEG